jgi:phosphate starvation-inducible PhoH-like protein
MLIPRTAAQRIYVEKLLNMKRSILVSTGPAGCGKTLLACEAAVHMVKYGHRQRIIVTRPAVSADEELGFLPGKLEKKMEPWIRPMLEIFEKQKVQKSVEIVPLAYMRGRTFKDSFIIADEMQNSTANQMKMVLTRLGDDSKLVVTGDLSQSDLATSSNGLKDFIYRMGGSPTELEYIDYVKMTGEDIQRHPAIKEVLGLY